MNYIEIEVDESSDQNPSFLEKILRKIIPAANPDLEKLYGPAVFWWLEYNQSGLPLREIGFDKNMTPIVLGPIGENYGFLIDSPVNWLEYKEQSIEAAENFELIWEQLLPTFQHLQNNSS